MIVDLAQKPWYITNHSLKRLTQRLGEEYWAGRKIKNMTPKQQRKYILKSLNKYQVRTIKKDIITYQVVTEHFTAVVVSGMKSNKIETIYETKEEKHRNNSLTYKIGQLLKIKNQQLAQELTCH